MNFSDLTFFILQPLLLFQYGFNKVSFFFWICFWLFYSFLLIVFFFQSQVAICISIGAGADVIGRIALAVLSSILPINIRLLYYITASLTFVTRIGVYLNLILIANTIWERFLRNVLIFFCFKYICFR